MKTSYSYGNENGYIYSLSSVRSTIKASRCVSLLLTACEKPFEITSGGVTKEYQAVAIKPLIARTLSVKNAVFIGSVINASHPAFRTFSTSLSSGVQALDRSAFKSLEGRLCALHAGDLSFPQAMHLSDELVSIAAQQFSEPSPLDRRIATVSAHIRENPNCSLTDLAAIAGLSYHRLSHLFSREIGLSLRSFQLWHKLDLAWRLIDQGFELNSVAARSGFADATHFCKVFAASYGTTLSTLRKRVHSITQYVGDESRFFINVPQIGSQKNKRQAQMLGNSAVLGKNVRSTALTRGNSS